MLIDIFYSSTGYSDFPTDKTFHKFYDLHTKLDLNRIASGLNICNGCGMPLTHPHTRFCPF